MSVKQLYSNDQQRTEQWFKDRCGKFTASRFKHLNGKGTQDTEVYTVAQEIITGKPRETYQTKPMEWGTHWEEYAVNEFTEYTKRTVTNSGFKAISDYVGGSVDGLIGTDAIIEVKCPYNTANHIKTICEGMPSEHMPQIQGLLWITGREWCDFVSFDPRIEGKARMYVEKILRDEAYIDKLKARAEGAVEQLQKVLGKLGYEDK